MGCYRRLPFDVRVAMWCDEHPVFMRSLGLASVATCAAGTLGFIAWVLS